MKKIILFLILLLLALPIQAEDSKKPSVKKIGNLIVEGIAKKLKMPFVITGAANLDQFGKLKLKIVIKVSI